MEHADVRPLASVVVPAYCEEAGIARTVHSLATMCGDLPRWRWEIVVVDDGSPDHTSREAATAAAQVDPEVTVRVLRQPRNTGLGGALRACFGAAQGEMILTVDADMSYSVDTLKALEAMFVERRPCVVVASPYMPGGSTVAIPPPLEFRSRVANKWLHLVSQDNIYTLTGMVRAYDGDFIRGMALKAVDADINVEILYKAQLLRASIVEVPAALDWSHIQERTTRSAILARRGRWNTYKQLVNGYLWRPFWFPLAGALVSAVVALALTITGQLGWHGVAVATATGAIVLTMEALSALQSKRYFEELFNLGTGVRRVVGAPPTDRLEATDEWRAQVSEISDPP